MRHLLWNLITLNDKEVCNICSRQNNLEFLIEEFCYIIQSLYTCIFYLFITEALDILSKLRVLDWDRIKEKKKVECNRFLRQLLRHDQNQNFKNRLVDVLVKNNFLKRYE